MATDNNQTQAVNYGDENIITLEGVEHIRRRPGMYIGALGNMQKLKGTLTVKNVEANPVGIGIKVGCGGTVKVKNIKEADTFNPYVKDAESKILVNGEEK